MIRHTEEVAKRRVGIAGWEPFSYEAVTGGILIEGGVPSIITKGPRKGQKKWTGPNQKTIVSDDETKAEFQRYETETGNCGDCLGEGKVVARWHYQEGTTYKPCTRCGGSGFAKYDRHP